MDSRRRPSLRASISNPSLRPISNGSASIRSGVSRSGSYRHTLLKPDAQYHHSIDKDLLPIPPLLTHSTLITTCTEPDRKAETPEPPEFHEISSGHEAGEPLPDCPSAEGTSKVPMISSTLYTTTTDAPHHNNHDHGAVNSLRSERPFEDHACRGRLGVSKVRPAIVEVDKRLSLNEVLQPSVAETPDNEPCLGEVLLYANSKFISKVRPYVETRSSQASQRHAGHRQAPKVEAYLPSNGTEPDSTTTAEQCSAKAVAERVNTKDLPKANAYWGRLPISREKQGEVRREKTHHRDSPHKSHQHGEHSHLASFRNCCAPGQLPKKQDESSQASQTQKPNHGTASWLRQLLGQTDEAPPILTRLPDRTSSRRGPHANNYKNQIKSSDSRTTTFSSMNAADTKALDKAMHNLEQLLEEAVGLANKAAEPESCGHLNVEDVPQRSFIERAIRPRPTSLHGELSDDYAAPVPTLGEDLDSRKPREHHHDLRNLFGGHLSRPRNARQVEGSSTQTSETCHHQKVCEIRRQDASLCSLDGSTSDDLVELPIQQMTAKKRIATGFRHVPRHRKTGGKNCESNDKGSKQKETQSKKGSQQLRRVTLRNLSHISIGEGQRFSLGRSCKRRSTTARDWSPARKKFIAITACLSTALVGILVGLYAGLVPSIQYYIADFHHYAILGNVVLYLGMALPTLLFWPLPLLHGRKPYVVVSLCLAMPLLFPQAIAIGAPRSPNTPVWRVALLLSRGLMGFVLGFASMNFHSTLTDLYGSSLMSRSPHQEVADDFDARRHGGGLGIWLGVWTWCHIGSLSLGFVVGAAMIEVVQPSWGLYACAITMAVVTILNVICPEVRRSAWRRSVAQVQKGEGFSRRLARGEIMMHRVQNGPRWWGQEVYHGVALTLEMLRQPGFVVMAVYSAWIYAQVVLIIVLLGSLASRTYRYRSTIVALVISSIAIGALIAIPFQKANLFSRARKSAPLSNTMTFDKKLVWSSHLIRRATFVLILPLAGIVYTFISLGPPIHIFFPSFLAGLIGFLSCLAISECSGLLMETWDCSDLQPGMVGRSTSSEGTQKHTNYSSFPRVTAGWNFIQGLGFIFAAGATGLGGRAVRVLDNQEATGIVAGILLILSILLLCTLLRFKKVQIIPNCNCGEMDRWTQERQSSLSHRAAVLAAAKASGNKDLRSIPEEEISYKPAILGNPVGKYRRINLLELGSLTRWTEIRKQNRFIDETAHLNRQALGFAQEQLHHGAHHSAERLSNIIRKISSRSLRDKYSHDENESEPFGTTRGENGSPYVTHEHHHAHEADRWSQDRPRSGVGASQAEDGGQVSGRQVC